MNTESFFNKILLPLLIVIFLFCFQVYDTSRRESFNKLEEWLNEVEIYSTKRDIIKMLVGNKIDKVCTVRAKNQDRGRQLKKIYKLKHIPKNNVILKNSRYEL